ncbi:hypothetical protein Vi05172_g3364 [Venturia inaequalis]|nr:hypothetical protein Vi05172_g3364 [Venturia inaequalis]
MKLPTLLILLFPLANHVSASGYYSTNCRKSDPYGNCELWLHNGEGTQELIDSQPCVRKHPCIQESTTKCSIRGNGQKAADCQ